jgi:hypothetical protein
VVTEELITFLRGKLDEAEQSVCTRESMAVTHETTLTPAEWRAAMALHPSTRGAPMPTPAQQRQAAARERGIADRYRHDVTMFREIIDRLTRPERDAFRRGAETAEAKLRAVEARVLHEMIHCIGPTCGTESHDLLRSLHAILRGPDA